MKNMRPAKWGFFGAKGMTDFDIGIGWQTWGNYHGISQWGFSFFSNEGLGELSPKYYSMFQLTIIGFYFRVYLLGPDAIAHFKDEPGKGNE